ncbi:MAG: hypothetical protein JXR65_02515 [Bacteroidales bacterium]|nr:hypothetical protein [Bacteroidales bacterium]
MKKIFLLFVLTCLFMSGIVAQSYGDINTYMKKVDDKGYIKQQRSYLTKIASITTSSRTRYARYLSENAGEVERLYTKAYQQSRAYEDKMKNKKGYAELAPKLYALKSSLRLLIRYSSTIKVFSARIANNYKSGNNRDYYYKIQSAYNSLIKTKKTAKEQLYKIVSWDIIR